MPKVNAVKRLRDETVVAEPSEDVLERKSSLVSNSAAHLTSDIWGSDTRRTGLNCVMTFRYQIAVKVRL